MVLGLREDKSYTLLWAKEDLHVLVQPQDQKHGGEIHPKTDKESLSLLDGVLNSEAFVMEYEKRRGAGMDIAQALVFTGHAFRLKELLYQPPNRTRPG